ncbi:MAG: hypothetical protein L0207_00735 [Chlamydiae bacterium]|nr:hypothetical protein [Chlamydiota bacterium]
MATEITFKSLFFTWFDCFKTEPTPLQHLVNRNLYIDIPLKQYETKIIAQLATPEEKKVLEKFKENFRLYLYAQEIELIRKWTYHILVSNIDRTAILGMVLDFLEYPNEVYLLGLCYGIPFQGNNQVEKAKKLIQTRLPNEYGKIEAIQNQKELEKAIKKMLVSNS